MKRILAVGFAVILFAGVGRIWAQSGTDSSMTGSNTTNSSAKMDEKKDMGGMASGQETTLTGILVDTKCYIGGGAKDNDHMGVKACGTMCLEDGIPAGLLVGDKLYTIVFPSKTFAKFVGQTVEITGSLSNDVFLVPSKAVAKVKGKDVKIKLGGKSMM